MKLKELKKIIDHCVEHAEDTDPDVEIWLADVQYDIDRIGQFGVMPDVTIHIKPLD